MSPLTRRKIDHRRRLSSTSAAATPPRSILELVTASAGPRTPRTRPHADSDDEDHLPLSVWKLRRQQASSSPATPETVSSPPPSRGTVPSRRTTPRRSQNKKLTAARSNEKEDVVKATAAKDREMENTSNAEEDSPEEEETSDDDDDDSQDQDFRLNDESEVDDDDDDDKPKKKKRKGAGSSSSDDDDDDEYQVHVQPPPQRRRARTPKAPPPPPPRRRRKSSAASTKKKMKRRVDSSEEDYHTGDDDDSEDMDDEDVLNDTDDNSVGFVHDDEVGDAESSSSSINDESSHKKIGLVKDDDIGTKDDDSSDDDNIMATPSPTLSLRKRRHWSQTARQEDFSSDSNDDNEEEATDAPAALQASKHSMPSCPSTHDAITQEELPEKHICFFPPDGQSRECFALETLRTIALTCRFVQTHNHNHSQHDPTTTTTTPFLQPPHFRSAMSDDLLDQIASRFGRAATNPNGEYYNRTQASAVTLAQAAQVWSLTNNHNGHGQDRQAFLDHLERYVRQYMGSQDVYCCPLCYIVSHQQLVGTDDDFNSRRRSRPADRNVGHDDDPLQRKYPTDFVYDPMTILGYLDNSAFRVAASFCFTKVSQLKHHLRQDHAVDTQLVEGNEVYTRYKIRVQDGLLQRFLKRQAGERWTTRQGAMLSYWLHGNNQDFVLLLSEMKRATMYREVLAAATERHPPMRRRTRHRTNNTSSSRTRRRDENDSDNDEHGDNAVAVAHEFLDPALDFFESFADKASDIWNMVAAPFYRENNADIQDFVLDNDDVDDDASGERPEEDDRAKLVALMVQDQLAAFEKDQHDSELRAERYKRMLRVHDEEEEDEEEGDDNEDDESEQEEDDVKNGGYFVASSSEEEDEWEKQIDSKRKAKIRSLSPQKRRPSRRVSLSHGRSLAKKKRDENEASSSGEDNVADELAASPSDEGENEPSPVIPVSSVRKRLVIQDDDDESD